MRNAPSTDRLQAFSDGVMAVIITIMVLELKVPHEEGIEGLAAIFPTLLVYLLSFAFTGIYWINHQHLVERIDSADHLISYANLAFLFCLSLLPFFTSYVIEKRIDAFAVILYEAYMLVVGFSFLMLRLAVYRRLHASGDMREEDAAERGKHLASLMMYVTSIPLAYFHPQLGLMLNGLVTVVWIIPHFSLSRLSGKGL